ncbi:MAG: hypothetical protein ACJ72J_01120 [Nitrososphaeraceae archaeon]
MSCKGICTRYKTVSNHYTDGQKRCQICELFIKWDKLYSNRLVINSKRPSSRIILEANTKDPIEMKSRVLPLLVRAGIDAFPKSSEMSKEEWLKWYDQVLDNMWCK